MNKASARRRVTEHPLFAELMPQEAKALRKAAQPMTFPAGAKIQVGGEVDRRCFVVIDGLVELRDGSDTLECGPGGAFGDAGSYGRALPATAVAKTQVRTFMIPSLVMASLANSNSSLALRLARTATESTSLAG